MKKTSLNNLELEIKRLHKTYQKNRCKNVRLKIEGYLKQRKQLINERINFTPDIVKYIEQVNQLLTNKTTIVIRKAAELNQQMRRVKELGDDFLEDFEIQYSIKIEYDGENLRIIGIDQEIEQEQSDYFTIADILYELNLSSMMTYYIDQKEFDNWNNEFPLSIPELDHVKFCYASHELFCHGCYSIMDIIRINSFWTEVNVKWQNFEEINN